MGETDDYRLESASKGKSGVSLITERSPQKNGLRTSATIVESRDTLRIKDYCEL
jgi:hypothetical protein